MTEQDVFTAKSPTRESLYRFKDLQIRALELMCVAVHGMTGVVVTSDEMLAAR